MKKEQGALEELRMLLQRREESSMLLDEIGHENKQKENRHDA